jgi:hypothetical protein
MSATEAEPPATAAAAGEAEAREAVGAGGLWT